MEFHLPHTLLHWILVGSSASMVLFFAGGLTLYFERAPRPGWVVLVHYVSLVLALLQFLSVLGFAPRSDPFVVIGVVMYWGAILLFLSAIEAAKRTRLQRSFIDLPLPDRLITNGPFRWVRHPFGSGYLLGALAAPVAIDHIVTVVVAIPLIVIVIAAALREERVWLSSPTRADEYRAYKKRTRMFIPFIG